MSTEGQGSTFTFRPLQPGASTSGKDNGGTIEFGAANVEGAVYAPADISRGFWAMDFKSVTAGGTAGTAFSAIIDTGTTYVLASDFKKIALTYREGSYICLKRKLWLSTKQLALPFSRRKSKLC